jgi:hypothetical protein
MKRYFKYIYFSLLFMSLFPLSAQEILYAEDFNECMVPTDWTTNISYGNGIGFYVGLPVNAKSDSSSIDGSCMMIFDDDILGNNTPTFIAEASTPMFSTKGYKTVRLRTDVQFRAYGTSTFSIYVEESDGTRILIAAYGEGQQTGAQFSDFVPLSLDLSFFTNSPELKLVYIYDDKEMFAWWGGIDNVEVIGSGEGEIIVIEQFNDCVLPEGWSTNILEGEKDWVLSYMENPKSSAMSMNGSCFASFDDDFIGRDAPFSTADLMTPWFDGSQYATFILEMELIFRRYGDFENISVFVNDGEKTKLVKEFFDAVGGPQITNYLPIQLDLTAYRSNNMQVVFRYDDGNEWGWWTGIDNVKIIGSGSINDLCNKADILDIGKACLPSENKNAIFSGPDNSCFPNGEGSLWFRLTAPVDGIIEIANDANYNDLISIYNGPCDALVEMSCTNKDEHGFQGEQVMFNATKDQNYFIRISGIDSNYGLSRGKNCIKAEYINSVPLPSSEDLKEMAMPLMINSPAIQIDNKYSNIEATLPEDNLMARSDLWYSFTTDEFQNISVELMSNFAENTVVYDSELSQVHAQIEGGNFLLNDLLENTTYYIQVSGTFAIIEGGAEIKLSELIPSIPEADDCFENMGIAINENISYNNMGQSFSGIHSSCDIYADKDKWFSFVSDGSLLYLNMESNFITNATIYSGTCDTLEEFSCHNGIVACDGSITIGGLYPNDTYYLQISVSQTNNNNIADIISFSLTNDPIELPELSINVSTQCLEDGLAELQIEVSSEEPYTLEGNANGDILFEGDSYLIVVIPENGCEKSIKGVVDCQNTTCNLLVESLLTFPSCNGAFDGSIALEIENGLGPFTYSWSHTEDAVEGFTSIGTGEYEVTVTDALGCVISETIIIEEPNLMMSMVSSTDQIFTGMDDGTASVDISGGTLPYTIEWSNGAAAASIDGLPPGDYSVTITDYNGCSESQNIIVNELDCAFTVDAELIQVTCFDGFDGSISISSSEDIASVEWDNDAVGISISGLGTGVFTATISLTNGCQKIKSFSIVQPEEITFQSQIDNVKCFGESNGMINPLVTGGNDDFTYLWDDGVQSLIHDELPAGSYLLVATDHLGCSAEQIFEVTQPDLLDVASSIVTDLSCSDSQDGQICIFVEGGTEPYEFVWEGLEAGMSKMTDLEAGTYNLIVTDGNQCTLTSQQTVIAPLPISVSVETISISNGNDGIIKIIVEGGTGPYEIRWYLNNEFIGMGEEISDLVEGIYRAVIVDAKGCIFETTEFLLSPTSIKELTPSDYSIYPNPAREVFTIKAENYNEKLSIKVLSVTGQDVSHYVDFDQNGQKIVGYNKGLVVGLYYLEIGKYGEIKSERLPLIISEF